MQHNAATAWNLGWTGAGVTIAVVDTGIDIDSPEFAGRIHPASRDVFDDRDTRGFNAADDHGTNVSLVAAGGRTGSGVVGIAYEATIMALRADFPGSCGADNPADPSTQCSFFNSSIAEAVDHAVANGAKVINLSLGGGRADSILREAVQRAVAAGVVVVVASGNDGEAEPDAFAGSLDAFGRDGVIVVGSVDADGTMSSFSNRAGTFPANYIAARGGRICCTYEDGQIFVDAQGFAYVFSGTSFAAPQVAGAAALLAQAFPNLTGVQIIEILLSSAFDAGEAGTDAVYGRGILDIAKAFAPQGTTSIAGGDRIALSDTSAIGSPAMGDATARSTIDTVILDKWGRAFQVDLSGTATGAQVDYPLHGAVATQSVHRAAGNDSFSIGFTIDSRGQSGELPRIQQLRLSREDAQQARVLASRALFKLNPDLKAGFTFRESASGLVALMQGTDRPAFMVADNAAADSGMYFRADTALALRQQLGGWGITASAETGEVMTASAFRRASQQRGQRLAGDVSTFGLAFDRRFGNLGTALGVTVMNEDATILGARFHEAFGTGGAQTLFVNTEANWKFADGWNMGLAARGGYTKPQRVGAVSQGSHVLSQAWSFDLQRTGVFGSRDSLAFRVSQPLRVESGNLSLNLPVSYDYATLTPTYGIQRLTLTPQGREIMGEIAWRGPLLGGYGSASMFYRNEPGHYQSLPSDQGVAFRWSRQF
ncbi:S8 family peptidase [Paraurantiacibacter namhicola]|uniref:S8 family peptidase n=1 Tax=Paraurantiacibacter namhicola TaxID=645517 RepID=UPI000A893FC4|nr:S8 family peptidase [Paraurantiacibacter namhicola]